MNNPQPPPADPKPDDTTFQTNIVTNIPIHTAGNQQPANASRNDDSKIMRDVGDQLTKEDQSKPKHHFWDKKPAKQPGKISVQPVANTEGHANSTPTQQTPQRPLTPVANTQLPAKQAVTKPAPMQPVKPKSRVPVAVIAATVVVTGGLIFLAYSSLK